MPNPKVLIVDDSQVDRMILKRAFHKAELDDIQLEEASDAVSALDRLNETQFDAVFLDVNLPGPNGYSVLRAYRAAKPSKWPLVFMYSSSDNPDDIKRAYDEKATAYLCKQKEFKKTMDLVTYCAELIAAPSSGRTGFTTLH